MKSLRESLHILADEEEVDAVKLFDDMASAQRGAPEQAMLELQRTQICQLLGGVMEHVGDITNRMAKSMGPGYSGFGDVQPKVVRGLRYLLDGYGFWRECQEQIRDNTAHQDSSLSGEELEQKIEENTQTLKELSEAYANAHAALPVYNEMQRAARDAVWLDELLPPSAARTLEPRSLEHLR